MLPSGPGVAGFAEHIHGDSSPGSVSDEVGERRALGFEGDVGPAVPALQGLRESLEGDWIL